MKMTTGKTRPNADQAVQPRPWYREPWPWVAIAIPAAAVIMGLTTLYLALANPDYLVVDEEQYREISSELRAQPETGSEQEGQHDSRDRDDGAR
jgi:hypothetical protein